MEKEVINEGAEYVLFNLNGRKILIDIRDILDIVPLKEVVLQGMKEPVKIMIYNVVFDDGMIWQMPLDEEILEKIKNFKNNVDKDG